MSRVEAKMEQVSCGQTIWSNGSFSGRDCPREGRWVMAQTKNPKGTEIYCNVHKGGVMRRSYGKWEFRPLTEEETTRLLKELAIKRTEQRRVADIKAVEYEEQRKQYIAKAWAELDKEADIYIEHEIDQLGHREDEWTYKVGNDGSGDWHNLPFDLKQEARDYPYGIRLRSTGSLTPKEARKLSEALVQAADRADQLNKERKPA